MLASFRRDKRGISEIVASLMLVLIVATAGVALYAYGLGAFSSSRGALLQQTEVRGAQARERLAILAVWNSTKMYVTVLNYGEIEIVIDSVYVFYVDGTLWRFGGLGKKVDVGDWVSVEFTPPPGQTYEIRVVTERGSKDAVYY